MVKLTHLIPLFPFAAFLINILFGWKIKRNAAYVSIAASFVALGLSVATFFGYLHGLTSYTIFTWLPLGNMPLTFGVIVDGLSCMMLLMVTIVGTLIQIYSMGYMDKDPRYSRFFAYMSLFMTSMLSLVISDNLVMFYMFWEGVGVCSYLLISFWFERIQAARAGMKAFITTRIGDTAFFLGILTLFLSTNTLYFKDFASIEGHTGALILAAILIFGGAVGKSAQFPLHVWLPDAMEGPTPVSALIHAATMVAAGIYLVARCFSLFTLNPVSLTCVAYIGAITAVMAATIATVSNDIKRVLAYSTISQLGLMVLGLGVLGYSAGVFHLMTHAFFKALLFLCAGSVIHGVHTQDIQQMGGLFKKMRVTGATFIIAALAIAGIPPLAGFWSKDEILSVALENHHPVLFVLAVFTSLLTSFYMFRLIFLTLFGKMRSELHPHESPRVMTVPLSILAVCSIVVGLPGSPFMNYAFQSFVSTGREHEAIEPNYFVMALSTVIALAGIGLAYLFYMRNNMAVPAMLRSRFSSLHTLLSNKYYFDEIYAGAVLKPYGKLCQLAAKFDRGVIDRTVDLTGAATVLLSRVKAWIDRYLVDGTVNAVGAVVQAMSAALRRVQTGLVQNYLLVAFFILVTVIIIKWVRGS